MSRPRASCADKAAELLSRRSHFTAQLAGKLRARGYPDEEIAETLERMAGYGYLDDRKTAAEFVAGRLARGPVGRRRLAAELGRRGAPAEAVEAALAELPADDRQAAREAAERWLARHRSAKADAGNDPRAALARHLDRQGFSPGAIHGALELAEA